MNQIINLEIHIDTPEAAEAIELLLTKVTGIHSLPRRMSLKEVEEYSGLSESTIRRYVKQNLLTPLQSVIRGKISFDRETHADLSGTFISYNGVQWIFDLNDTHIDSVTLDGCTIQGAVDFFRISTGIVCRHRL